MFNQEHSHLSRNRCSQIRVWEHRSLKILPPQLPSNDDLSPSDFLPRMARMKRENPAKFERIRGAKQAIEAYLRGESVIPDTEIALRGHQLP